MKTIITVAAALFAINVNAADIYHGFGTGNSDLSTRVVSAEDFAGVSPSAGVPVRPYHGLADGNPDLFSVDGSDPMTSGSDPDIYMGFGGNPDLQS